MTILSAANLNVTLNNHHILQDISFEIEEGEIAAIVGPNGSGKTTLLKAILGLIPYEGNISVFGKPLSHLTAQRIGYVPQRLDFDRTMPVTVQELLSIHLTHGEKKNISASLASVDAESLLNRKLGVLSGGEFQRVLVALAILNQPEILFLDEPAASIDIEGASEVYALIERLQKENRMTIVIVSHDVDVVYRYATTVLCLNHKLLCEGTPRDALTPETLERLYGSHHTLYAHTEKRHV